MFPATCRTPLDILAHRGTATPDALAFRWLENGDIEGAAATITYGELHRRAAAMGQALQDRKLAGERALLIFPPGLDFIVAYHACLYAGVVAVPAYPPDPTRLDATLPRLLSIVRDARPAVVLTNALGEMLSSALASLAPELAVVDRVVADRVDPARAERWVHPGVTEADLAFLQYTSGSTGNPKGVMVTHGNLMANNVAINRGFPEHQPTDHGVSWLPMFHDMGLIGSILQPIYRGLPFTLFSPLDFLRKPMRWLRAVSHLGATITGGPDFAYALCARKATPEDVASLDLSSLRVAYSGAEPVRPETLDAFATTFAPAGFRRELFLPLYGLAESTLMVSCPERSTPPLQAGFDAGALADRKAAPGDDQHLVACGGPAKGIEIAVADPTTHKRLPEGAIGEIRVRGASVAKGYFDQPEASAHAFDAKVDGEGGWLATGDLGFLHQGQLVVAGRSKDVIIVRGRNHYPQDIERIVEQAHPDVRPGCVAAFALVEEGEEGVGVAAEVAKDADVAAVHHAITKALADQAGLRPHGVALLPARSIPKTSSGKIQRQATRKAWEQGTLRPLHREGAAPKAVAGLPVWMTTWLCKEGGVDGNKLQADVSLSELGLDSLATVQFAGMLEDRLGTEVPLEAVHGRSLAELAEWLDTGGSLMSLFKPVDLDGAARLSASIVRSDARPTEGLLLTGATGFLGAHLLHQLLDRGAATVTCLVRARDPEHGRERIAHAAERLGIALDLSRVTVLCGDLSKRRLGLSDADLATATACASILHCGASVDWSASFDTLRATNVDGTKRVVELAASSGAALHFVSSLGVFPYGLSGRDHFPEDAPLTEGHLIRLGYFQSKYAAEKVLEQARERGIPVTIYRPAYVTGDAERGVELDPAAQLMFAFTQGIIDMAQAPAVEKRIDAVAVDATAAVIAALTLDPATEPGAYNLRSPEALQQSELYARLRRRGWRLDAIAFPRWRERVLELPRTNPDNLLARFTTFYRVTTPQLMRRLETVLAQGTPVADDRAQAAMARHGLSLPTVASLIDPWLDRAIEDGRLKAPARVEVTSEAHEPKLLPLDLMAQPWTAGLPSEEARLLRLYQKAKDKQWDASKRIDWSLDVDPENPEALPDQHVPIYGSPIFDKLTHNERVEVRRHYQGWQLSQFFAGEQGAMLCASRIVTQAPTASARFYAATQVVDEARHLEIFGRLIHEKVGVSYESSTPLQRLLDQILNDRRWDVTCLGMQVLIEGLGLAAFSLVRDRTSHPLIATAHAYVCEDEARHVSFGKLLLADLYPRLTEAEQREREEFVIEASYLLRDRFSGREVWERLGLPVEACLRWTEDAGVQSAYRNELFKRIVPVVRSIGLWSPKVQEAYRKMGVLNFSKLDIDRVVAEDEAIAYRLGRGTDAPTDHHAHA